MNSAGHRAKNQIQQKPSNCYGSDITEGILHVLSYLILPKTLWKSYRHSHVTREKTETQRRWLIYWTSHSWWAPGRVWDAGRPDHYLVLLSMAEPCQKCILVHPIIFSTLWPASLDPQAICQTNKQTKVTSVRNLEMDRMWSQDTCAYLAFCKEESQNDYKINT